MGLINRTKAEVDPNDLTKTELEFILTKLKSATYIGEEFEMFYKVWVKLVNKVQQHNK